MISILKKAYKQKKLVSLCVGKVNWDTRIIGYVKKIEEEYITLQEVDIFGAFSKEIRLALTRITEIELGDSYNLHLEKLKGVGETIKIIKNKYLYNDGDPFFFKLASLIESQLICTFFFDKQYAYGIASKLDNELLHIELVGYTGTWDGEFCCKIDALTSVRYEGAMEAKITYLLKLNETKGIAFER